MGRTVREDKHKQRTMTYMHVNVITKSTDLYVCGTRSDGGGGYQGTRTFLLRLHLAMLDPTEPTNGRLPRTIRRESSAMVGRCLASVSIAAPGGNRRPLSWPEWS